MPSQFPKLLTVAQREYVESIRSPWFIAATIFGPLIFALMFVIPAFTTTSGTRDDYTTALYNINVLDATTTGLGERVAQILGGGKYANQPMPLVRVITPEQLPQTEEQAIRDTRDKKISGYLIIDSQTVVDGTARFAGRRADSQFDMLQVKDAIREGLIGLRLEQLGMSPGRIDSITIINPVVTTTPISDLSLSTSDDSRFVIALFITMLLYTSIVLYGQNILNSVVEEKTSRVAEILASSIRPSTLLSGKIIGISAVGLTQQLFWIVGAFALISLTKTFLPPSDASTGNTLIEVINFSIPFSTIAAYVGFFLLGFLFFGSLYAAAGSTVSNESDARQAAQPIVTLLIASVFFFTPLIHDPSGTLAKFLTLFPLTSPILMPLRMATTDVPPLEVAASFIILILTCLLALYISARIYRVGLLMYGKRPSFRELTRWLRQS
jgi:ABC-2 type transport system permease protein